MSMYWHMLVNIRNRIGKSGLSVQRILFFSKYRYFHLLFSSSLSDINILQKSDSCKQETSCKL